MFTWKHKYHFYIEGPKLEVGVGVATNPFSLFKKTFTLNPTSQCPHPIDIVEERFVEVKRHSRSIINLFAPQFPVPIHVGCELYIVTCGTSALLILTGKVQ